MFNDEMCNLFYHFLTYLIKKAVQSNIVYQMKPFQKSVKYTNLIQKEKENKIDVVIMIKGFFCPFF